MAATTSSQSDNSTTIQPQQPQQREDLKATQRQQPDCSLKRPRRSSLCSQASSCTETTERSTQSCDGEPRNVSFTAKVVVRRILSHADYSPEELLACWWQEEENRRITRECCKQIKKMESGGTFKDKKYCSRGLESHTRLAGTTKTSNRRDAAEAVLLEQEDQRRMGVIDEEAISERYRDVSSSCQLWSGVVGLRDQRSAEEAMD